MTPEPSRTEQRQRAYRRGLRRAFLFALVVHLIVVLLINPSFILRIFKPDVLIGYPGGARRGALSPAESGKDRITSIRVRRYTGPLTITNVEVIRSQAQADARFADQGRPGSRTSGTRGPLRRNTHGGLGGTGDSLVLELGEDWSMLQSTGQLAQSEKFQVLKIVRPEYPKEAIHAGIEGLVKLEVSVDSSGAVIAAHAIENTAGDGSLAQAAIEAMFHWEFKPYRIQARPIPFTLLVPFRYRLIDE